METSQINNILRAALSYERMRVEAASYNLAISNVPLSTEKNAVIKGVTMPAGFASYLETTPTIKDTEVTTKKVLEPSHPLADSKGMVSYPKIDTAKEMATLVSATRAYEANIRAYNSLRAMTLKAFEIGK